MRFLGLLSLFPTIELVAVNLSLHFVVAVGSSLQIRCRVTIIRNRRQHSR